jgi:cation diffusion facilitator family transporter
MQPTTFGSVRDGYLQCVEESIGKQRTALISIAAATALVLLKLVTGFVTGSLGLISAGIESSGDVVAAVVTFFAIRVAGKPADEDHQYGHMRFENVAALFEAAVLVAGGAFVVHEAHARLVADAPHDLNASWSLFLVLGVAIAIDISRTITSLRTARKYRSAALRSNAFHFGADLVGTVAVLVGLGVVAAGYPRADAIAALVVAALIFFAAGRLVYENFRSLMDTASADAIAAIRTAIEALDPAVELRRLRVREAAGSIFADVVIGAPATAALAEGHTLADRVEAAIHQAVPDTDVVVQVEPREEGLSATDHVLAAALSVPGVREAHNVTVLELPDTSHVALHLPVPPELPLTEARPVAVEVEAAVRARIPAVGVVQIHLEPLEGPVPARTADAQAAQRIDQAVADAVRENDATLRSSLNFDVDGEFVTFVTVETSGAVDVATAHRLASRIEQHVHDRIPGMRDLVVQVEPAS